MLEYYICLECNKDHKKISQRGLSKKIFKHIQILCKIRDGRKMVEKEIRGGICHAIYQYAKANNKYTKYYNKNIESSYLMYWDASNLYEWAISQKLHVENFK